MYTSWTYINEPIGNNEFSYQERIALWSIAKIFVPDLIQGNKDNLAIGSEIVFEEAEFTKSRFSGIVNNKLISCTGLKHFIETTYKWTPVYIIDNHNHALTFRYNYYLNNWKDGNTSILHIDQHADTKPNDNKLPISSNQWPKIEIETFINEKTNVGNFITVALNSWIINEVIQIRTDYTFDKILNSPLSIVNYILDIDIDFRVGKEISQVEIQTIRNLIQKAKLVTIATSPYFIEQNRAIEIIKTILE